MRMPLSDNLDDVFRSIRRPLLLYSGGLDSKYFLLMARERGVRPVALHVHLGPGNADPTAAEAAATLGADYRLVMPMETFTERFIAPAICANATYQGQFPVCSSLSRPLMAEEAVRIAAEQALDGVVHSAGYLQNSASRFNRSIRALAPHLRIGNPFLREPVTRPEKLAALNAAGVEHRGDVYSIDENIWGRVVENGVLDDPGNVVPDEVFCRTRAPIDAPRRILDVALRFEDGLPVAIDGQARPLVAIITEMNRVAGEYGIGRFNGLEDTGFGVKNHEVRESPAAAAILQAHAAIECATLTQGELRTKHAIDAEWTALIVQGHWHTPLKQALDAFVAELSRQVQGEVVLRFAPGSAFVAAIRASRSPHFWNARHRASTPFADFSYREYFEIVSLADHLRQNASAINRGIRQPR
jgi:argininosuccinate synthase